MFLWLVTYS